MIVFEDRSAYTQGEDSVATVTLEVECSPGQVAHISEFLVGVTAKAGVYSASIDHVVAIPEKEVTGEANGEQPIQQANPDHPGEDLGRQGRDAEESRTGAPIDQHENGSVAGTPGESTAPGSGKRDA